MASQTRRKPGAINASINKEVLLRTLFERFHVALAAKILQNFADEAAQAKLLSPITSGSASSRLVGGVKGSRRMKKVL